MDKTRGEEGEGGTLIFCHLQGILDTAEGVVTTFYGYLQVFWGVGLITHPKNKSIFHCLFLSLAVGRLIDHVSKRAL